MAFAKHTSNLPGDASNFKCSICLEIFEKPIEIACGHSFCKDCIMGCLSKVSISQCPICRTSFRTVELTDNTRLANQMKSSFETCSKCHHKIKLPSFRKHKDICTGTLDPGSASVFKPLTPTKSSAIPNRSTFKCPYCTMNNLDRDGLIDHVSENHSGDVQQVVCPICASMPWGKSDQTSGNFHQHLTVRHKFDYETFVDYNDEEDAILQAVLEKSKEEV